MTLKEQADKILSETLMSHEQALGLAEEIKEKSYLALRKLSKDYTGNIQVNFRTGAISGKANVRHDE